MTSGKFPAIPAHKEVSAGSLPLDYTITPMILSGLSPGRIISPKSNVPFDVPASPARRKVRYAFFGLAIIILLGSTSAMAMMPITGNRVNWMIAAVPHPKLPTSAPIE